MKKLDIKFQKLHKIIAENQSFVLTSHVNTDGDAIGSMVAMYTYLQSLAKNVQVLLPAIVPARYHFLDTEKIINQTISGDEAKLIAEAQVIIMLDVSSLNRLGKLYSFVKNSTAIKVCIDHHPFDVEWIDLQIINTERVATGELIYQFFKTYSIPISPAIARSLYTSILSDSGSFRFHRTDEFTFNMAAELVKTGIDPAEMYMHVYENANHSQLKAWGHLLSLIQSAKDMSWLVVTRQILEKYKISVEEIEGIIDLLRKNKEALIVLVFIEKSEQEILVGLRSKNGFDVGSFARLFGGGGHFHAAGFTAYERLDKVVQSTLQKLEQIHTRQR